MQMLMISENDSKSLILQQILVVFQPSRWKGSILLDDMLKVSR